MGNILEKGDLVSKVLTLVADEKRERERQRQAEEMEEMERIQREIEAMEERERRERMETAAAAAAAAPVQPTQDDAEISSHNNGPGERDGQERSVEDPTAEFVQQRTSTPLPTQPKLNMSSVERNGLCIICQDEEANIAIVDCGYVNFICLCVSAQIYSFLCRHLAMCRACSDLVMASSRECPLCRTRIVTEARLLRIFKT